jgi:hypothetical protein
MILLRLAQAQAQQERAPRLAEIAILVLELRAWSLERRLRGIWQRYQRL